MSWAFVLEKTFRNKNSFKIYEFDYLNQIEKYVARKYCLWFASRNHSNSVERKKVFEIFRIEMLNAMKIKLKAFKNFENKESAWIINWKVLECQVFMWRYSRSRDVLKKGIKFIFGDKYHDY